MQDSESNEIRTRCAGDRAGEDFILARALWGQGQRQRARAAAQAALRRVSDDDEFSQQVRSWLDEHRL